MTPSLSALVTTISLHFFNSSNFSSSFLVRLLNLLFLVFDSYSLTLRRRMPHICGFLDCFSFGHFFGYFLTFLERKTKFSKFWTKFWIKQVDILPSRWTSLLLRNKPVQPNWLRLFKNFKKQCAL